MDPNIRSLSEPPNAPEAVEASPPTSLPEVMNVQTEMPLPSISTTAAWVEKIELQPQHQDIKREVQGRAIQEIPEPQQKKPKQKAEHVGPTEKDQKYDRQLRLWGANGQCALEDAHVCLVNTGCGAVGIEALKNLVLPGIGNFTIIDNKLVTEEDLGVNFFLDESQLGKPRGECLCNMLCELNPYVTGDWEEALGDMSSYDIFIWTTPSSDTLVRNKLERYCHDMQKPLITINSQGFFAYFHIQFSADFPIVETHPEETALRDLRVLNPWNELEEWAERLTEGLEEQSNHKHGHIPWLALMLYYIKVWKEQNKSEDGKPGDFIGTFKQKKELQKSIQAGQRYNSGEGGEENYDQAYANVMKIAKPVELTPKVREIFDLCDREGYRDSPDTFWHMARALKAFYKKNHHLPLAGYVPDMKAESEVYVQLQNLYKAQARRDVEEMKSFMRPNILQRRGIEDEVTTFCKNAETLHIIRHSFLSRDSFEERELHRSWARAGLDFEKTEKTFVEAANLASGETNGQSPDLVTVPKPPLEYILLALRSMETYDSQDLRDVDPDTVVGAIQDLVTEPRAYVQSWHALHLGNSESMEMVVREVERAQGGELHNTASLVGGLVAQECIKVLTRQYVPIDNLVVWDGVFCRMGTFRL